MNDAFAPLTPEEKAAAQAATQKDKDGWTVITPIPEGAPKLNLRLGGNEPDFTWTLCDAKGQPLGVECRWQTPGGKKEKEVRFATWCSHADGRQAWRFKHLPAPRPLFRLDKLAARPDAPVLLVEGPKKCQPAEIRFKSHVATAWSGGCESIEKVDWSLLKGRHLTIWPDNDAVGRKAADKIASLALAAGAASALIVPIPENFPPKWDLGDKPPVGADLAALLAAARSPSSRAVAIIPPNEGQGSGTAGQDEPVEGRYRMLADGLHFAKDGWANTEEEKRVHVTGFFTVLAEVRDDGHGDWGWLLAWTDHDAYPHTEYVNAGRVHGNPGELCAELQAGGLDIKPKKRDLFIEFLLDERVSRRGRLVKTVGWHSKAFVLPGQVEGISDGEALLLHPAPRDHAFNVEGALAEWQDHVAKHAVDNTRVAFAISAAFAPLFLKLCNVGSGGFNFHGRSSIGKTTALWAAGSVWGGASTSTGYMSSWRTTDNALEGAAAFHNDCLLCLDEMGQAPTSQILGKAVYMLGNGSAKGRMGKDGSQKPVLMWRLIYLSSSETTLADKIAEDRGAKTTAGMKVRAIDIPADPGCGYGLFERVPEGFETSRDFADHLVEMSKKYHGTAARAFTNLIAPDLPGNRKIVEEGREAFVSANCAKDADGQVKRVAAFFGLVAATGDLAIELGILTWPKGEALKAAETCFEAWLAARGSSTEAAEITAGIATVKAFLSAHGMSRCIPAWEEAEERKAVAADPDAPKWKQATPRERATNVVGFREKVEREVPVEVLGPDGKMVPVDDGYGKPETRTVSAWDFYITEGAWPEVTQGHDPIAVAKALRDKGLLVAEKGGRLAAKKTVPGHGRPRLYHLLARTLEGDDG